MAELSLVNYRVAYAGVPLPPIEAGLFEYVLAGSGVFVRGERRELSALLPIASCEIRGLAELEPDVELRVTRVSQEQVQWMLEQDRRAQDSTGRPTEIIFHLSVDDAGIWNVETPEQLQGPARAKPLDDSGASSYARAFVEVHSHVNMSAQFSGTDDGDEIGFRVYAVLGRIFTAPEMRVRVGLYGYRWEIPATEIFDLPPEISDANDVEKAEMLWERKEDAN
ncbi:MAG: hypothetical protein M1570_09585 [Chloroflexi bacterium]|nr:hypothetical protein [Chloroflexota bacterium]